MMKILVVDDNHASHIAALLAKHGYETETATDLHAAIEAVKNYSPQVVILDAVFPDGIGSKAVACFSADKFLDWLDTASVMKTPRRPDVLMLSGESETGKFNESIDRWLGEYRIREFILKPANWDLLETTLTHALGKIQRESAMKLSRTAAAQCLEGIGIISACDQEMQALANLIYKAAPTDATVLITGETGVGKELVAKALAKYSPRVEKPFVAFNCAAYPPDLIESELLGHEKGAFTGATISKPGKFEMADKGTLFLDEIGNMPEATQVKLLRVLQERQFERLGGTRTIKIDIRLIAATNCDLESRVRGKLFREDLFYRLNVVRVSVPALRERPSDIEPIAKHFEKRFGQENRKTVVLDNDVIDVFRSYSWPGNVRELENIVERLIVLADHPRVTLDMLRENPEFAPIMASTRIPNEDAKLVLKLKNELREAEGGTWKELADHETTVFRLLTQCCTDSGIQALSKWKAELEKQGNDPQRVHFYLVLLFLVFRRFVGPEGGSIADGFPRSRLSTVVALQSTQIGKMFDRLPQDNNSESGPLWVDRHSPKFHTIHLNERFRAQLLQAWPWN